MNAMGDRRPSCSRTRFRLGPQFKPFSCGTSHEYPGRWEYFQFAQVEVSSRFAHGRLLGESQLQTRNIRSERELNPGLIRRNCGLFETRHVFARSQP